MPSFVKIILAFTICIAVTTASYAVLPDEILKDPALESRARIISQDLRCLVCQNQSIDDSDASLARDLRLIVRERLTAGDSNAQIFDYVVARYGNFVLLKPPVQSDTALLWAAPFILLMLAVGSLVLYLRQRPALEDDQT